MVSLEGTGSPFSRHQACTRLTAALQESFCSRIWLSQAQKMTGLEKIRLRFVLDKLSSTSGGTRSENCLAKEPRQFFKSFWRFRRMEACEARFAEPQSFAENPVRNGVFSFIVEVTR